MFLDILMTVLASVIIGWNVGNWLLPAGWLAILCLATLAKRGLGAKGTVG